MHGPSSLVVAFAMAALNPSASASNPPASSTQSLDAAIAAYQNQQYATALKLFEAAAQKGNREAQHTLAFMYRDGRGPSATMPKPWRGTARRPSRAMRPRSTTSALMYAQGEGVKPDPATAEKWFRRAADHGSVEAQVKLAEIADLEREVRGSVPLVQQGCRSGRCGRGLQRGIALLRGTGRREGRGESDRVLPQGRPARHARSHGRAQEPGPRARMKSLAARPLSKVSRHCSGSNTEGRPSASTTSPVQPHGSPSGAGADACPRDRAEAWVKPNHIVVAGAVCPSSRINRLACNVTIP